MLSDPRYVSELSQRVCTSSTGRHRLRIDPQGCWIVAALDF